MPNLKLKSKFPRKFFSRLQSKMKGFKNTYSNIFIFLYGLSKKWKHLNLCE